MFELKKVFNNNKYLKMPVKDNEQLLQKNIILAMLHDNGQRISRFFCQHGIRKIYIKSGGKYKVQFQMDVNKYCLRLKSFHYEMTCVYVTVSGYIAWHGRYSAFDYAPL